MVIIGIKYPVLIIANHIKEINYMSQLNNPKFITTFNPDTAAFLSYIGFKQLQKTQSGYFVFVNEPKKMIFEKLDDVAYTNTLFFN